MPTEEEIDQYLAIVTDEEGRDIRKHTEYKRDDRFYIYKYTYDLTKYYGTVLYVRDGRSDTTLGKLYRVEMDEEKGSSNQYTVNMFKVENSQESALKL